MDLTASIAVAVLVLALGGTLYLVAGARGQRGIATPGERATYDVLHRAGLAAEPLRAGLDPGTAAKAVRHLRALVGSTALGIGDDTRLLALDGPGEHHRAQLEAALPRVASTRGTAVLRGGDLSCDHVDCPIRGAVIASFSGDGDQRGRSQRSPTATRRRGRFRPHWRRLGSSPPRSRSPSSTPPGPGRPRNCAPSTGT